MTSFFLPLETYRFNDPIENLKMQVTLRKRGSQGAIRINPNPSAAEASGGSASSRRRASASAPAADEDEDEDEASSDDEGDEGSETKRERKRLNRAAQEDEERLVCPPRTFMWQEKAFSPMEVRAIRSEASGRTRGRLGSSSSLVSLMSRSSSSLSGLLGYSEPADGTAPLLSNHHREVFSRYEREAEAAGEVYKGEVIYTRVNSESFVDPTDVAYSWTDSRTETPTPLARSVLSGSAVRQHRDMLGEPASVVMHIFAALPYAELEGSGLLLDEASATSGVSGASGGGTSASGGVGLLSARLGRRGGASTVAVRQAGATASRARIGGGAGGTGDGSGDESDGELVEVLLCSMRLYAGGRLDLKPPFSVEPGQILDDPGAEKLAKWYAVPGTRYEYAIENVSEGLGKSHDDYEAAAERLAKLTLGAQGLLGRAMPELDFDAPPRKAARVHHLVEIEAAYGFGPRPLFITYYALAAPGWRLLPHCVATAVTQTSNVGGADQKAVFGFPLELAVESDGTPTAARPPLSLFLQVTARDAHERMNQLGYAQLNPQPVAGAEVCDVGAWRPAEGRVDALRRFFVGGTEELRDLRALGLPEGLEMSLPQVLNKHGLETVTTGAIRLKVNTIVQQQQNAPPAKAAGAAKPGAAARRPELRKPGVDMGSLRSVLSISTLGRSETAADRVKKRLDERRRAE